MSGVFLTRPLRVFGIVTVCLAAAAPCVSAEPVTVTGGRFNIVWDDPTYFEFVGTDGFALNAWVPGGPASPNAPLSPQRTCYRGCAAGTSLDLGAVVGSESPVTPFTLGMMTGLSVVNGTEYGPFFNLDPASTRLAGLFTFDAPTIVLPPIASVGDSAEFTAPFVFSGTASGFEPGDVNLTAPFFSVMLAGRGTARVQMETYSGTYSAATVRYIFEDASPVPEPASLALFTTGAIGVAVRARRKRGRRLVDQP